MAAQGRLRVALLAILLLLQHATGDLTSSDSTETAPSGSLEKDSKEAKQNPAPMAFASVVNEMGKGFLNFWQKYNFLVNFYVPWCEHSQALYPLLSELALRMTNSSVNVIQVDVSQYGEVAAYFQVTSTPNIKFLKQGIPYNYNDHVTIPNLMRFIGIVLGPAMFEVNTTDSYKMWKGNLTVFYMLLHSKEVNSEWQSIYQRVAEEKYIENVFLYTSNQEVVQLLGVKYTPLLVVLKDSNMYEYKDVISPYSMGKWVDSERFEAFPEVNLTTARRFIYSSIGKKLVMLSTGEYPSQLDKRIADIVKSFALGRSLHSSYQFIWNKGKELPEALANQEISLPSLLVYDRERNLNYIYDKPLAPEQFSQKTLSQFLVSVSRGNVKASGGLSVIDRVLHFIRVVYGGFHFVLCCYGNQLVTPGEKKRSRRRKYLSPHPKLSVFFDVFDVDITADNQAMLIHKPILSIVAIAMCAAGVYLYLCGPRSQRRAMNDAGRLVRKELRRRGHLKRSENQERRKETNDEETEQVIHRRQVHNDK